MNIHSLAAATRIYMRTGKIIIEAQLGQIARRSGLMIFAGAFVLLAVVFLNLGLFAYLGPRWGPVWTPVASAYST
jgi:hypothetical protein